MIAGSTRFGRTPEILEHCPLQLTSLPFIFHSWAGISDFNDRCRFFVLGNVFLHYPISPQILGGNESGLPILRYCYRCRFFFWVFLFALPLQFGYCKIFQELICNDRGWDGRRLQNMSQNFPLENRVLQ